MIFFSYNKKFLHSGAQYKFENKTKDPYSLVFMNSVNKLVI